MLTYMKLLKEYKVDDFYFNNTRTINFSSFLEIWKKWFSKTLSLNFTTLTKK